MKAVEVIDLLSSPPNRLPISKSGSAEIRNLNSDISQRADHPALTLFEGENSGAAKENFGWLLPSDGLGSHVLPSKSAAWEQNRLGKDCRSGNYNNTSLSKNATIIGSSRTDVKPSKRIHRAPLGSKESKMKGEDAFFVLSDDSDGAIDLHETEGLIPGPATKKRRITAEPERRIDLLKTTANSKGIGRSFSDITNSTSRGKTGTTKSGGLRRSKTAVPEDDPIDFTSSPDVVRVARHKKEKSRKGGERYTVDSDGFALLDPKEVSPIGFGCVGARSMVSRSPSSDMDLPDIGNIAPHTSSSNALSVSYTDSRKTLEAYNKAKAAKQKALDKARNAKERSESKEAEKERKHLAKEENARQKQMTADLAKVNTLRIDKKVSTPEMIIDLPLDLDARLAGQVAQILKPLDVQCTEWSSPIPNVIKWQRKIEARYNEEMGNWEPAPKHIKAEKHVMCVMAATEFVDLAMGEEGRDLDAHVVRMKSQFEKLEVIYLIEGLTTWMRKNKTLKNRQFTEAVRSQMAADMNDSRSASQKSRKRKQQETIDEDIVEDALLRLQLMHGALVHHTAGTIETAEWVVVFTQHISTIPYRHQRMTLDTAFCMETGQVKSGDDTADTFLKMLQEINRVTAPIAHGIAAEYPSVQRLVRAFETEGKDLLHGVRKSANKDGAFSDREVGKKISRRLWGIFLGKDEGSMDV